MQSDWRWCNKCQGLAFSLNQPSVCPAGGSHDHSGSGNYALAVDDPSAKGQSGWRWCKNCQVLAFSENLTRPPPCPAGEGHDYSDSGNYTVPHDDPSGQPGWRWCNKCQGLAFSLNQPSVCPAGGSHDHTGSGNYSLASVQDNEIAPGTEPQDEGVSRNLLVGFNYPWAWNAMGEYFGGGKPPGSNPGMDDWIKHLRANLRILKNDLNIRHVRIFLFCNAWNYGSLSPAPKYKFTLPTSLHAKYIDHLKEMFIAFQTEDMLVIPSLISFEAFWPVGRVGGTGGRSDIAKDPSLRTSFMTQVLDRFLSVSRPYRSSIFAWEVINEPIWDTSAAHATILATTKSKAPRLVPTSDVTATLMTTFINEALKRIHAEGFSSTVGHRYYDDLANFPTGKWRQFHYYPESINLNFLGLGSIALPYTDPVSIPDYTTSQALVGEFACRLPGQGHGGAWPELGGVDAVDVATAVHERLRLLNNKGYGLALVWPDLDGPGCCGRDPLKLSLEAQAGIKRFMATP